MTENDILEMDDGTLEGFVLSCKARMDNALKLGTDREITFFELNRSLLDHPHVYFALEILHNRARIDHMRKTHEFDVWWDKKFMAVKQRENRNELAGSKWASATELASMTRSENEEEYYEQCAIKDEAECKYSFTTRLLDIWKTYHDTMKVLSSNTSSEVRMNSR